MTEDQGFNISEARMADGAKRRYRIQTHDSYGFYAGTTPDGRQVLMGLLCPNLVAFTFDADGTLLGTDERPVPFFQGVRPPYDIYDQRLPPLIEAWQREMSFQPATITVTRFFNLPLYVGIMRYPSHFEEILLDPEEDEDEKDEIRESQRSWDAEGMFVLQWGNDYWLNAAGEVESS